MLSHSKLEQFNQLRRDTTSFFSLLPFDFVNEMGRFYDPNPQKKIEFGFANVPNGENERIGQYERYRPHIEALAKQIESKQPAFDFAVHEAVVAAVRRVEKHMWRKNFQLAELMPKAKTPGCGLLKRH